MENNNSKAVNGKGSDLKDIKLMQNRGKKKMLTQVRIKAMLDIAEKKGNKAFVKSLWNAYRCLDTITTSDGRMFTNYYCKSRFCAVCAGNRKAELINKYKPVIEKWDDPYFVTLTVKSIPAKQLSKWINEGMIRGLKRIEAKFRKRNERGKGIKLMGIKSLECNFNPKKRTYNPHFHLIVPNKETAETLINEWLNLWHSDKTVFTNRKAQDMRPIRNLDRDLIETIKYGTKVFTQPDPDKSKKRRGAERMYIVADYNILNAMRNRHLFEHFGFKLPTKPKVDKTPTILTASEEWKYENAKLDWRNEETDEKPYKFHPYRGAGPNK